MSTVKLQVISLISVYYILYSQYFVVKLKITFAKQFDHFIFVLLPVLTG